MAVRLSALRAGSPLPAGRFVVLISVRGWADPRAIVRLEGLGQLNKSNELIGNRTHDLPTCSIVPQTKYVPSQYWREEELYLLADNSPGQNKNHATVRLCMALTETGRFSREKLYLPVRGHSFLPCDRSFSVINSLLGNVIEFLY
jgi:hypothetical protein